MALQEKDAEMALLKTARFLETYLSLANAHATDFITKDAWNTLLPFTIQEELTHLSETELKQLSSKNSYRPFECLKDSVITETEQHNSKGQGINGVDAGLPEQRDVPREQINEDEEIPGGGDISSDIKDSLDTCTQDTLLKGLYSHSYILQQHVLTTDLHSNKVLIQWKHKSLAEFCGEARTCSLEELSLVCPYEYVMQTPENVKPFVGMYMNAKKSHEIEKMAGLCETLVRSHDTDLVIDFGSGKGYLGSYLSLQYGIPVLGIDSVSINTHSAERRTNTLAKQWGGLTRNKDSEIKHVKLTKKEKKLLKQKLNRSDISDSLSTSRNKSVLSDGEKKVTHKRDISDNIEMHKSGASDNFETVTHKSGAFDSFETATHKSDISDSIETPTHKSDASDCIETATHKSDASGIFETATHKSGAFDSFETATHKSDISDSIETPTHKSDASDCIETAMHKSDASGIFETATHKSDAFDSFETSTHTSDISDSIETSTHASDISDCIETATHKSDASVSFETSTHTSDISGIIETATHKSGAFDSFETATHKSNISDSIETVMHKSDVSDSIKPAPHKCDAPYSVEVTRNQSKIVGKSNLYKPVTMFIEKFTDLNELLTDNLPDLCRWTADSSNFKNQSTSTPSDKLRQYGNLDHLNSTRQEDATPSRKINHRTDIIVHHSVTTLDKKLKIYDDINDISNNKETLSICQHFSGKQESEDVKDNDSVLWENEKGKAKLDVKSMLTGLHTCGNLASCSLELFVQNPLLKVLCNVGCCYHLLTEEFLPHLDQGKGLQHTESSPGFPLSRILKRMEFSLGQTARNLASQSVHRLAQTELQGKRFFPRALLEVLLRNLDITSEDIQGKSLRGLEKKCSSIQEFISKACVKLDIMHKVDDKIIADTILEFSEYEQKLVAFFQLRTVLAPCIESLILLDRACFLLEQNTVKDVYLVKMFDPVVSPRCYGIIATKA